MPRKIAAGLVLAASVVWLVACTLIGSARADVAATPPTPASGTAPSGDPLDPVTPGIYGPQFGGGTMAPPPGPEGSEDTNRPSDPSWWDIPGQIESAIDTWFGNESFGWAEIRCSGRTAVANAATATTAESARVRIMIILPWPRRCAAV